MVSRVRGVFGRAARPIDVRAEGRARVLTRARARARPLAGDDGFPVDAIHLEDVANVTITGGAGEGTFDGNGPAWWGYVKYVELTNHRPILLRVKGAIVELQVIHKRMRCGWLGAGV